MEKIELNKLSKKAIEARRDCINTQKLIGSGHLGGSFSAMEMMIYLYFKEMKIDTKNPLKEDRDIFILSKGHASIGYYSVMARRGFFPLEELKTYRNLGSRLQGHTHMDDAPGIECSTGSLGQGLSFGIGLALAFKKKNMKNKIYVMLGDGELQEGQVWEAANLQGSLKLDNLITIIDNNKLQLDDTVENILGPSHFEEKFKAFGFNTISIDGHSFKEIESAFRNLKSECANVIISNTVKGKGISFMENQVVWHAKKLTDKEYDTALKELEAQEVEIDE